jgi:hypothetical protein
MQTILKLTAALALTGFCLNANAQEGQKEMKEDKMELKASKPMLKKQHGGGRHTVKTAARREGQMMKQEEKKMDEKGKM